jgi:hypothetical protein
MSNTDINQLDLTQEVHYDPSANAEEFFAPRLVDDGEHLVILGEGNRGVGAKVTKGGKGRQPQGYVNAHLWLKSADNGNQTVAFDNASSLVFDSGLSRLHAVMDLAGHKIPNDCQLGEIVSHTKKVLAQAAKVKAFTQWEAQVNTGTKDEPKYVSVLKGQKNFPKVYDADGNDTGKFSPDIWVKVTRDAKEPRVQVATKDTDGAEQIRAQVAVVRYGRP